MNKAVVSFALILESPRKASLTAVSIIVGQVSLLVTPGQQFYSRLHIESYDIFIGETFRHSRSISQLEQNLKGTTSYWRTRALAGDLHAFAH